MVIFFNAPISAFSESIYGVFQYLWGHIWHREILRSSPGNFEHQIPIFLHSGEVFCTNFWHFLHQYMVCINIQRATYEIVRYWGPLPVNFEHLKLNFLHSGKFCCTNLWWKCIYCNFINIKVLCYFNLFIGGTIEGPVKKFWASKT